MKGKILFVAGVAAGYVLGARAGRQSYDKIKNRAENLWENPNVQKGVHQAEDFVKENAPIVGSKVKEAATEAGQAATAKVKSATSKTDSSTPTT